MGEPWAGQVKLCAWLEGAEKVEESAAVENFGPDDPTGSKKACKWQTYKMELVTLELDNLD
jgi:hypothetical protein